MIFFLDFVFTARFILIDTSKFFESFHAIIRFSSNDFSVQNYFDLSKIFHSIETREYAEENRFIEKFVKFSKWKIDNIHVTLSDYDWKRSIDSRQVSVTLSELKRLTVYPITDLNTSLSCKKIGSKQIHRKNFSHFPT